MSDNQVAGEVNASGFRILSFDHGPVLLEHLHDLRPEVRALDQDNLAHACLPLARRQRLGVVEVLLHPSPTLSLLSLPKQLCLAAIVCSSAARSELAQSMLAYGRFKLGSDLDDGKQLLERALQIFEEIDATGWIDEKRAALNG